MVKQVKKLVVKKGQYAVILHPVGKDGRNQLGRRVLRTGLCSFFLQPGMCVCVCVCVRVRCVCVCVCVCVRTCVYRCHSCWREFSRQ